ncbi:zinc ribbon domain-containing protein [Pelosinus sp. UFO1]|uniref:zinc ribbon domain-containing protein n=1 Tax=Pelosinus sp. UFO1 TaxID=484770 RepID=UPI0004D1156E|nr:zinc ribbon domain-containing protein [Pelosinus sp. UFO1]AIF52143.1 hypothetical protein UFO1_2596 [Pelosinus sp. UFO1]
MSYVGFKYCPFCGGEMPQQNMMRFCPFCGEKFLITGNKEQEINKKKTSLENLSLEVDIEAKKGHEILIGDEIHTKILKQVYEYEYCSIILKHAIDTQKLIDNLEKVLLRGSFAIRLAVDNMPSLIIYKVKSEEVAKLLKIFIHAQASISVVPGEFDDKPTVEQLFPMFNQLPLQLQQGIISMPINLWVGDYVSSIFFVNYRNSKTGILVITNNNIYILYKNTNASEYRWLVISYTLLSKIIIVDNLLQLIYKDSKVEEIVFVHKMDLVKAYQAIQSNNF